MSEQGVRVRVPATSANLGPGFDSMGLALAWYDDVTAVRADVAGSRQDLQIKVTGCGAAELHRDERHLIVRAMDATFARLGTRRESLELTCANTVPHGRGLGSSAAAVVSGVLLARALVPAGAEQLDDAAMLEVATSLEGHADNAAAALLGGFTVAWSESGGPRALRLEPSSQLRAVLLVPEDTLATSTARGLLPELVPHADAAHAAARSALLVHAVTADPSLLLAATEDRLHQAYREPGMPGTLALLGHLRKEGFAAVVSGAGPSVLVLGGTELTESAVATVVAAQILAGSGPAAWTVRAVPFDRDGAQLLDP